MHRDAHACSAASSRRWLGGATCQPGNDTLRWARSTGLFVELAPQSRLPAAHLERLTPALLELLPGEQGLDEGYAVSVWCDERGATWAYVLSDHGRPGQVGLVSEGAHHAHRGALPMVGAPLELLRGAGGPRAEPTAGPDAGAQAAPEPLVAAPPSPLELELELAWQQHQREEDAVRGPRFLASCAPGDAGCPHRAPWRSRDLATGSLAGPSHIVERTIEVRGDRARVHLELSQEQPEAGPRRLRRTGPYEVTRRVDYEGTVRRCAGGLQFVLRSTCLPTQSLFFACLAKTFTVAQPGALARHVTFADDAEGCSGARWEQPARQRVPGYECYYQHGSVDGAASFVVGTQGIVEHLTLDNDCGGWRLLRRGSAAIEPAYRRP